MEVYDPATDTENPVEVIVGPPAGFVSLRDAAVAVDDASGDVYVLDDTQPDRTEEPLGRIDVFDAGGAYQGHLKYDVIDGGPSGLAVDNSEGATQGRVYVTTGNTNEAGVYAYPPGAATGATPLAPRFRPTLSGSGLLFPTVSIGGPGGAVADCSGDACQVLPPEPSDPTLTTLLSGHGNPKPRYARYKRGGKKRRRRQHRHHHRGKRRRRGAGASAVGPAGDPTVSTFALPGSPTIPDDPPIAAVGSAAPGTAGTLLPGTAGFAVAAWADGGAVATKAGSHPYQLDLSVGLDQGGEADLRSAQVTLPPGLLLNPANANGVLCSDSEFSTPRATPFAAGSESGESCHDQAQVGTVEVTSGIGGGKTRTFGLYDLQPRQGFAARFGAAPFGQPLAFDVAIRADVPGAYMTLEDSEVPQALKLQGMVLSMWGVPWDASHDAERGDCLNEAGPSFGWGKCSVGDPRSEKPRAFLTLPTVCGEPLSFELAAGSWQQPGEEHAGAVGRDSGGEPAPVSDCGTLSFDYRPEGLLSVKKASSATGYAFRFATDDEGFFANPRTRLRSLVKKMVVRLPQGVSLNPSVGAGLGTCSEAQLAAETAFNSPGAGCPNASKIGDFIVGLPYFTKRLRGSVYLAKPYENPFGSLLAVYLVAKSADRGLLFRIPGKLTPDPGDGTLTGSFDDLPQLPYEDLEVNFRSGQRAPLVSPPYCGQAISRLTLGPWAAGVPDEVGTTDSPIETGVDDGPCPDGSVPPFHPEAVSGGVNANVGSYTPYYVHLIRKDTEQEITSYSLVLPKGITGKLAGIPFCPEANIEAARHNTGVGEEQSPSCPSASQVGRTDTGYGVGAALTYAPGRIYLAGPYHGAPLSLVTVNSATVGPFDLGTIVIRSAFQVDTSTAQLRIDSSASDPIPHIIDGIPLHLREVRIYADRYQFTHNPSSCEASQLESTLTGSGASFENSADDSTASVAKHFQLLNCLTLGFHPKLGIRLRGSPRRGGYPSMRASFVSRGAKDSNLKKIEVQMPHAEFLAQNHIRTVCTRVQFEAERCPSGSVYGKAAAYTPLFDEPLHGKVYLRSSSHRIPDLVTDLHSGAVRIEVDGRIGPAKHGIRAFFDNLPDAPIERFTMTLFGGRRGLLQNSSNICANLPLASVKGLGQNNRGAIFTTVLRGQCGKKHGKHKGRPRGKRR